MLTPDPTPSLLQHLTPPLSPLGPALLKVVEDVLDPHEHSAGAEGDEDTDDHYHCHGDGPLVQVKPAGEETMTARGPPMTLPTPLVPSPQYKSTQDPLSIITCIEDPQRGLHLVKFFIVKFTHYKEHSSEYHYSLHSLGKRTLSLNHTT